MNPNYRNHAVQMPRSSEPENYVIERLRGPSGGAVIIRHVPTGINRGLAPIPAKSIDEFAFRAKAIREIEAELARDDP